MGPTCLFCIWRLVDLSESFRTTLKRFGIETWSPGLFVLCTERSSAGTCADCCSRHCRVACTEQNGAQHRGQPSAR